MHVLYTLSYLILYHHIYILIQNQNEVSAAPRKDIRAHWSTGQGVYFNPKTIAKTKDEL